MDRPEDDFIIFPWSSKFETGIPGIDVQHQALADLVNALSLALVVENQSEVTRLFAKLGTEAQKHFAFEQAYWQDKLPTDQHGLEVDKSRAGFAARLEQLQHDVWNRENDIDIEEAIHILVRWLIHHILKEDMYRVTALKSVADRENVEAALIKTHQEFGASYDFAIETMQGLVDKLLSQYIRLQQGNLVQEVNENRMQRAYDDLQEKAVTDKLTGLYNRHYFGDTFDRELKLARRDKKHMSFMMLDIDYFKKLNDTYGHDVGDEALQKIGKMLNEFCRRPTDFAFRLGGEEFGVLVVHETKDEGVNFAEKIREAVMAAKIPNENSDVMPIATISIGLVSRIPSEKDHRERFTKQADMCLYKAKEAGRNRVVRL